jgi:hypothetical protein
MSVSYSGYKRGLCSCGVLLGRGLWCGVDEQPEGVRVTATKCGCGVWCVVGCVVWCVACVV